MKKILIMFVLLSTVSVAQTVSLNDLIEKSKCKTFDCFSDLVTKKGFSFYEKKDTLKFKYCTFLSSKSFAIPTDKTANYKNVAMISINTDGSVATGFRTAVSAHYLDFMNQLKKAGFTERANKTVATGKIVSYLAEGYPKIKILVATNSQIDMDALMLPYVITLVRYP
ncbi:MAG: hypothetical protein IPP32_03300 [Bacteroidetes bacterium]|nr:hypothetical protein [Bacteroidota bacterium]